MGKRRKKTASKKATAVKARAPAKAAEPEVARFRKQPEPVTSGLNFEEKETKPPTSDSLGTGATSSSSGGAKSAAAALTVDDPHARDAANQREEIEALMSCAEMTLAMATRIAAARLKGVVRADVDRAAKMTETERSTLRGIAPMAAPFFSRTVASSPYFGPVLFGALLVYMSAVRTRDLKETARARQPKHEITKQEHDKAWGPAADAVPVGTVPTPVSTPNGEVFPPKAMSASGSVQPRSTMDLEKG